MATGEDQMVIGELYISNAMISDGVDAMREAKEKGFNEAEMVLDIYLAMAGSALKTIDTGEATVQ